MAQSFFHLAPDNDPLPEPEPFAYCNPDDCEVYTEAEHDAILDEAERLSDALFTALNAYSAAHPGLSYEGIFHALDCMAYSLNGHMREDTADA